MSGIYGYFGKKPRTTEELAGLQKWNHNYGHDAEDFIQMGNVAMGCSLNHITVLAPQGDPIVRYEQYTGVFDALLYNRDELAEKFDEDISGWSDEELLMRIWVKYGATGFREVNGDFSGAIWDGEKLHIFRDHLGIRPLYWYQDEEMVLFSTDLRGICATPGADLSINEELLYANFTGYILDEGEITDFDRINETKTATVITIKPDMSYEKNTYWRLREKKIRYKTDQEYYDRMRELVYDAIRRRLAVVGDQPVGAEMSGGLDSTVITVILKKMGADLYCYSWSPSFEQVPLQKNDERKIILETCKQFGIDCELRHYEFSEKIEDYIERLEKEVMHPDYNTPDIACAMEYFQKKWCKIGFSGWGGDEGVSHRSIPLELWLQGERIRYISLIWSLTSPPLKLFKFIKRVLKELLIYKRRYLLPKKFISNDDADPREYLCENFRNKWRRKARCVPFSFHYNPKMAIERGGNRSRLENAAMHAAKTQVQYLFPFLDYRVEDYSISIPRYLYWNRRIDRYIYRETFKMDMVDELFTSSFKEDYSYSVLCQQQAIDKDRVNAYFSWIETIWDENIWDQYLNTTAFHSIINQLKNDYSTDKYNYYLDGLERCLRVQLLVNNMKKE